MYSRNFVCSVGILNSFTNKPNDIFGISYILIWIYSSHVIFTSVKFTFFNEFPFKNLGFDFINEIYFLRILIMISDNDSFNFCSSFNFNIIIFSSFFISSEKSISLSPIIINLDNFLFESFWVILWN